MQLGRGAATDILSIGLAATDYVGHSYGTDGSEMCLQLFSLDRDLGDFFALLDRSRSRLCGGADRRPWRAWISPSALREQGVPAAARVDPALAASAVGKAVGARLGLAGPVLIGESSFGDIYLDAALKPADRSPRACRRDRRLPRPSAGRGGLHQRAAYAAPASPTGSPDKWTLIERARASFDASRSGDFIVLLKTRITPIPDTRILCRDARQPVGL